MTLWRTLRCDKPCSQVSNITDVVHLTEFRSEALGPQSPALCPCQWIGSLLHFPKRRDCDTRKHTNTRTIVFTNRSCYDPAALET